MIRIFASLLLLSSLMACSARTCTLEGAYLDAREYPDMQNPLDGDLPPRDPAYQIPPKGTQEYRASRSYTTADGESKSDCLDRPPRLVPKQES